MLALLTVVEGPDQGKSFELPLHQTLQIGRNPEHGICLTDPRVSRVHCWVRHEGNRLVLGDNNSTLGTWVNEERITERALQNGDVLRIGDTLFALRWTDSDLLSTAEWIPPEPL